MSSGSKLFVGFLAFVALGALGIHGLFLEQDGFAERARDRLEAAVLAALSERGYEWAEVTMAGQRAVISGVAPTFIERDDALGVARRAAMEGGILIGGVTRVSDRVELLPVASPYRLTAVRSGFGPVLIEGSVPNRAAREALMLAAHAEFPGGVDDAGVAFAAGAPAGADWGYAAGVGLELLARLRQGQLTLEGETLTLTGAAGSERILEPLRQEAERVPAPFEVTLNLEVLEDEDLDDFDEGEINRGGACQERFDLLMLENTINFETDSAELAEGNLSVLDRLVSTAARCSRFRVIVEGHTDNSGLPERNEELSLARARAVANYLVVQGVSSDRIEARGLGARFPLTDNDTPEGRAVNRRIEFTIDTIEQ